MAGRDRHPVLDQVCEIARDLHDVRTRRSALLGRLAKIIDTAVREGVPISQLAIATFRAEHGRHPTYRERRREADRLRKLRHRRLADADTTSAPAGVQREASKQPQMEDSPVSYPAYYYPWPYPYPLPPHGTYPQAPQQPEPAPAPQQPVPQPPPVPVGHPQQPMPAPFGYWPPPPPWWPGYPPPFAGPIEFDDDDGEGDDGE